jgi:hypothetical protein
MVLKKRTQRRQAIRQYVRHHIVAHSRNHCCHRKPAMCSVFCKAACHNQQYSCAQKQFDGEFIVAGNNETYLVFMEGTR